LGKVKLTVPALGSGVFDPGAQGDSCDLGRVALSPGIACETVA